MKMLLLINIRSKLLILENIYINQKMMNSYVFTYHGTQVQEFIARWLTWFLFQRHLLLLVPDVLGFHGVRTDVNPQMETDRADKDRPRIQVVDYVYKSPILPHTNLQDSSPIVIPGV